MRRIAVVCAAIAGLGLSLLAACGGGPGGPAVRPPDLGMFTIPADLLPHVQYWRDAESIYAYAGDPDRRHRPAWTAFYRRSRRATRAVGIWHETYAVPAGAHESVYVGMPPTGLGKAFGTSDARVRRSHARLARPAAAS